MTDTPERPGAEDVERPNESTEPQGTPPEAPERPEPENRPDPDAPNESTQPSERM